MPKIKPVLKIPMKYADILGLDKSFLVRVNQGKRRLSLEMALALVKAAYNLGEDIDLLELRPDLAPLVPYLCRRNKGKGKAKH